MPIVGLGLHVLVALFFAIHVVRHGRELYWLIILFSFPLLGSIVYFLVVYLPGSRLGYGAHKAAHVAAKVLDPGRELREAQQAFELTPTAQNQMRLAAALLDAGQADEAAVQYESCLKGPFASEPDIRFGAARAYLESGNGDRAAEYLMTIRRQSPNYRPEALALLLALAYARSGRNEEARNEFADAEGRYGSVEIRIEYALWALSVGDSATALRLQAEVDKTVRHWDKHTRAMHKPLLKRMQAAFAQISQT